MNKRKAKRDYTVTRHPSKGGGSVDVHATSVGNAMAKARRAMGWTHYGADPDDGGFRYYSIALK